MFKKILVPLDGSIEAEAVIPYVRDLASRFNSEVDILGVGMDNKKRRVNQLLDDYVHHAVEHLQKHDITCRAVVLYSNLIEEVIDYTEVTAPKRDLTAKAYVFYGGPADNILKYTKQHHPGLVVMATHGRGGLTRWWLGSVSEKVVSESTVPVLLIHSKHSKEIDKDRKTTFKRILAPLDGSEIGEAALHNAEAVALKTGASMILLHVIPEPHDIEAKILGQEFNKFVKAMRDAGQEYLEKKSNRLKDKGIDVKAIIVAGDPAERIVDLAKDEKVDMIAMSTHGRSGMARWVLGSVADKILHESKLPMWLVRSREIVSKMHLNSEDKAD